MHVAILGLGPSLERYVDLCKRLGNPRKLCDETWGINAVGAVIQCDRVFHMDDVRVQEKRAEAAPQSNIAAMLQWLKGYRGKGYTSRSHQDYPGLQDYPLQDVINGVGVPFYFNGTAAYAAALAIYERVSKITFFGCDFTYANAHHAEAGRACLEYWIGVAAARGIELAMPRESSLMDACEPFDRRTYGYDCVNVVLERGDDGYKVGFTPRETPSAEETERRYDHTASPNPLLRESCATQASER